MSSPSSLSKLLIILDRDGVLNEDTPSGITSLDQLVIYKDGIRALCSLPDDIIFVVATNQANLGRGLISNDELIQCNDLIDSEFKKYGRSINKFYICPHTPEDNCLCRKPRPGLLSLISEDYPHHYSIYIGDSDKDLLAASKLSIPFILVGTGKGTDTKKRYPECNYFATLEEFCSSFSSYYPLWEYHNQNLAEISSHLNQTFTFPYLAQLLKDTVSKGGLIFTLGNGGSCAHADHLAAELLIRFESERDPIPALNLLSSLTSLSAGTNDYSFNDVPLRVFKAFESADTKHAIICFSTSGNSSNVVSLASYASSKGHNVIGVTGVSDSQLASVSTYLYSSFCTTRTAVVQDYHQFFIHSLCISIDHLIS